MLTEKEKLEEEIRFLQESLKMKVITEKEYKITKQRTEQKIKNIDEEQGLNDDEEQNRTEYIPASEVKQEDKIVKEGPSESGEKEGLMSKEANLQSGKEDYSKEEFKEIHTAEEEELEDKKGLEDEKEPEIFEIKEDQSISNLEDKQEDLKPFQEEEPEKEKEQEEEIKIEKKEAPEEEPEKEKDPEEEAEFKSEEQKGAFPKEKKSNKKIFSYIFIIIIISLGGWFFFNGDSAKTPTDILDEKPVISIECYEDKECSMKGKIGICENPGEEIAKCSFIEDIKVRILVLNSGECFDCKTSRVMSIIKGLFPNVEVENKNIESNEGMKFSNDFRVSALPAYILDKNVIQAHNYKKFSSAFNEINGKFVMKNSAANANYYFKRKEVPNQLELFVKQGQEASLKAEKNLKEFLDAFEVSFNKYNSDSRIVKELGINTFPSFLINNQFKFSGVQPANKIKENFCQVNYLEECNQELSESLV